MSRNIVICLDGTGNRIEDDLSNVLKLYRIAPTDEEQLVFYDQGVGTLGQPATWGRFRQKVELVWGLATGFGIDGRVLRAYRFLIDHYREGDRLFLFGFSRGAFAARMLAGLIYTIGILSPDQRHLAGSALAAYKGCSTAKGREAAAHFRRILRRHDYAEIHFMGLWDTVSSLIVPTPRKLFGIGFEKPYRTRDNPAVRTFRHALAVDEKRRMFRREPWQVGQEYRPNPHMSGEHPAQDAQEAWFPGVHSDIGGGYGREQSALAQVSLVWMVKEAESAGLRTYERMFDHVARGIPYASTTEHLYPKPDPLGPIHDSMTPGWLPLEYFPKLLRFREWPKRTGILGLYLPRKEPRPIAPHATVHVSAKTRVETDARYRPVNLPAAGSAGWDEYIIIGDTTALDREPPKL